MELGALCLTLVAIVLWAGISTRAAVISTPIFFVAIGLVLAEGLHLFDVETDSHQVKIIAEVTLVWVLFADASRIRISDLRADLGRCVRLLGVGLPLTIASGALAGYMLFGISPWYALLLGAALAPTDAALGSAVMSDQRVPQPVRRVLNVESGLNDGIATPVVMVALAGIATEAGLAGHETPGRAVIGLLVGGLIGVGVGAGGGFLLRQTRRRGWSSEEFAGPAVLALSLLAYLSPAGRGKWLRRRIHRRHCLYALRRPSRGEGGLLRRTDLWPVVDGGLAAVRGVGGPHPHDEPVLAGGGLCRTQPDDHPHGTGRTVPPRLTHGLAHGRIRRLVRTPWTRLGGVRVDHPRGAA